MRSDKAVKTAYLGLQLFYMAEVCMISGFAVLFLSSRGMNNSAAGATVALARLLSILILNPLSRELDTDKVLLKKLFPIAAALLFLLHVLLVFVSSSIFYTFLVFAAASMVSALCSSLSTILLFFILIFSSVGLKSITVCQEGLVPFPILWSLIIPGDLSLHIAQNAFRS